jgi:hypothetical protein
MIKDPLKKMFLVGFSIAGLITIASADNEQMSANCLTTKKNVFDFCQRGCDSDLKPVPGCNHCLKRFLEEVANCVVDSKGQEIKYTADVKVNKVN